MRTEIGQNSNFYLKIAVFEVASSLEFVLDMQMFYAGLHNFQLKETQVLCEG